MIFVEESLNSRKRSDPVSFCFVFVLLGFWKFDQIWCNLKEIDLHGEILVWWETLRKKSWNRMELEFGSEIFCIFWDYQTFRHF